MAASRYIVTKGFYSEWRGERVHVQAGTLLPGNSPHLRGHAANVMPADSAEQIELAGQHTEHAPGPGPTDTGAEDLPASHEVDDKTTGSPDLEPANDEED